MQELGSYPLIIVGSLIIIASFFFSEVARRTSVPSVLLLILLGVALKLAFQDQIKGISFDYPLELLGIIGLIMIVLEAALELKLSRDKILPIAKAGGIALAGLLLSAWACTAILQWRVPDMTTQSAWIYATPLSILSSAIIIPSVGGLRRDKKEFHIYESTFSDIAGIIVFYYIVQPFDALENGTEIHGPLGYLGMLVITIIAALVASYALLLIFQQLRSHVKLFLLIAMLLLLYAIGKTYHLSALIIILVFGLMFANTQLFFPGRARKVLLPKKISEIYDGLHVVTLETAFVVRTFFFVLFGLTIDPLSLVSLEVATISTAIIASIYLIRFALLRVFVGRDLLPQLWIAPRGLITVLLYNAIPDSAQIPGFEPGILLFVIIGTSLIMTYGMVRDKGRASGAVRRAQSLPVDTRVWEAPTLHAVSEAEEHSH